MKTIMKYIKLTDRIPIEYIAETVANIVVISLVLIGYWFYVR